MKMKKILIAETNVDRYGDSDRKTGVWLEEITSFYDIVTKAGYDVDFASANGGAVPVDPASAQADSDTMRIFSDKYFHKAALEDTKKFSDIKVDDYIECFSRKINGLNIYKLPKAIPSDYEPEKHFMGCSAGTWYLSYKELGKKTTRHIHGKGSLPDSSPYIDLLRILNKVHPDQDLMEWVLSFK